MSLSLLLGSADVSESLIEEEFENSYIRLMKGLGALDGGNLMDSILKLHYVKGMSYNPKEDTVDEIVESGKMNRELCVNKDKEGIDNFNCICGKKHIYKLNLLNHTNVEGRILLGSTCVDRLKLLKELCGDHQEVLNKIDEIMERFGYAERKREYRKCWCCKKYEIKRGYNYTEALNKHFCRKCLTKRYGKHYISCSRCKCEIKVMKTKNGREWRLMCYRCWRVINNRDSVVINTQQNVIEI